VGKAKTRSKVLPRCLRVLGVGATRIARIHQTRWGRREYLGLLTRNVAHHTYSAELGVVKRRVDLPSEAICQGEVVANLPDILTISIMFVSVGINHTAAALRVT